MRLILDECIDEALRQHFAGHDCQTCRYAGFAGLANGDLLTAAEQAGFAVLTTVDQNMPAQQRLEGRSISLLVLRTRTTIWTILSFLTGSSRSSPRHKAGR